MQSVQYLQLCTHWPVHQAPVDSYKPEVTQAALVKLSESQNKQRDMNVGKGACTEDRLMGWGEERGGGVTYSECNMYEMAKEKFNELPIKKEGIWKFHLGFVELIMIWKCDCCHAYHLKGERKTFYYA